MKLTDEMIELAAKAAYNTQPTPASWESYPEGHYTKTIFRQYAEAALSTLPDAPGLTEWQCNTLRMIAAHIHQRTADRVDAEFLDNLARRPAAQAPVERVTIQSVPCDIAKSGTRYNVLLDGELQEYFYLDTHAERYAAGLRLELADKGERP